MLLIAILVSSAYFFASLTSSFLLSSVGSGNTNLIDLPSFCGFIPKSAF